jgi:laminin alpha 1/2
MFSHADERFRIQNHFIAKMEFRTTRQEGVIMTISHPFGDPALAMELHNGLLYFRVIAKGETIETNAGDCEFCLCDDRWHTVIAEYTGNKVILQVDNSGERVASSDIQDLSLNTNYPLYIGGFPGGLIKLRVDSCLDSLCSSVYDPQGGLQTGEYFHGCLRNVHINNALVHWHGMSDLIDVHVSACPRPHMLLW